MSARYAPAVAGHTLKEGAEGSRCPRRGRAAGLALALALLAPAAVARAATEGEAGLPFFSRDQPGYGITLEEPVVRDGGARRLRARIVPRGAWHLAAEYPVVLVLRGEGTRIVPERQTRTDAVRLDPDGIEFEAERAPGSDAPARVTGSLRFGICLGTELCQPIQESFEADLP